MLISRLASSILLLLVAAVLSACSLVLPDCPKPSGGDQAAVARRACHGEARAQYALGLAYEQGEVDGAIDLDQARSWYKRAAEPRSGTMYIYSPPVGKEQYGRAIPVTTGPSSPGDLDAKIRLALIYLEGRGVEVNLNQARKWLKRAAAQGDDGAAAMLHNLGDE